MIVKLWIKIREYGLQAGYSEREYKQIVVGNQVLVSFALGAFFTQVMIGFFWTDLMWLHWISNPSMTAEYAPFSIYYSIPTMVIVVSIVTLVALRPYILQDELVASTAVFLGLVYVTAMSIMLGEAASFQLVALIFIPTTLFFSRNKAVALSQATFIAVWFVVLQVSLSGHTGIYALPAEHTSLINGLVFAVAAFLLVVCSYYLWSETLTTENELETSRAETRDTLEKVNGLLKEVQALKEQQDADYFLITLLLEPVLSKNELTMGHIKASSFCAQKKKFRHRDTEYEIGGDINIIDKVRLAGGEHMVLVNGDAMGKSIQGAGGALVFGTVFEAIINRNRNGIQNDIAAEDWMVSTLHEIEAIFDSFDGTMSMSLILMLINQEGLVTFINLEHPYIVKTHGGKPEFLERNIDGQRVGFLKNIRSKLKARSVQLERGDALVFGSDGKDDLNNKDGSAYDVKPADFLAVVQATHGEPDAVYGHLKETKQFTDDFSVIKVEFLG